MPVENRAFFLIDYSVTGGVEKVNANLSFLFQENNIDFNHIISLYSVNEYPEINYASHLKVHVVNPISKRSLIESITKVLQENNITTILFQGDNMTIALAVLKAAKKANCKAILHYHGSPHAYLKIYIFREDLIRNPILMFKWLFSKIVYPFKKNKLKRVIQLAQDGFVCVSHGAEQEIKDLYNLNDYSSQKIITIYNPLLFEKINYYNLFSEKEKIISFVSRLTHKHKNAMLIVKTWMLLADKYPEWKLQILGDGPLKTIMESVFEKNKVQDVLFYGNVKNIEEQLIKSSIAVSTSNCEGFGLAMAEAAYFGNALVATKSDGGLKDIIFEDQTGFFVPLNDALSLALSIEKLIQDRLLCTELGKNAQKRISDLDFKNEIIKWKKLLV
ncbi:glycosyltransferase [Flavobacterium sp. LS2P90]|uniref:Glycosyltransferase n=1 Tax=Flavobacterium xylosi TaxID=3230415 RepID=A0ABW6HVC2_9FLAO